MKATMQTERIEECPLCRHKGRDILHAGLVDRLQGVPGLWAYERCAACRLIYLNPRPIPEELHLAYASYPTHDAEEPRRTALRRAREYVRGGYLARAFGYQASLTERLAGLLAYLHPGQRAYMEGSIAWLVASQRGRVLDVGAGAGRTLGRLEALGWQAEGVEPDERAASVASGRALVGFLEEQDYPDDHFDAVIVDHVIEHVHDPVGLLSECRRVLRRGGILVVATPNADSMSRTRFGWHWRVFEPPRHLTVFSRETLETAAAMAGFPRTDVRSGVRGADGVFAESGGGGKVFGQLYQYTMSAMLLIRPDVGEELVMRATR